MKKIYFVSSNVQKYEEIKKLAQLDGIDIAFYKMSILELQTDDMITLIKEKARKAFENLRRPVLVEHTELAIRAFHNLPGLHTSQFYSKMGYEEIVEYCRHKDDFEAYAKSMFCLCDGKDYFMGEAIDRGTIIGSIDEIKQVDGFDWDIIFMPKENNPERNTYAQSDKSKQSMRASAWKRLKEQVQVEQCFNDASDKEEEEKNLRELAKLIKQKKVLLFIGAGISASLNDENNVKFPAWKELIDELSKMVDYDRELFSMYGDNMMLAEYVSLSDKEVVYNIIKEKLTITDEVRKELEQSEIYDIICGFQCPIIYTTNYDKLIEEAFEMKGLSYSKISNINDMKEVKKDSTRIMKFHGDIEDKDSIVLSESQYFERMNFQSFMDIQFQADILQYHILFLGYSMSDINIKLLLYLAKKRWTNTDNDMRAYIYTATPNAVQKRVFEKNHIVTVSRQEADKKEGTLKFLRELKQLIDCS